MSQTNLKKLIRFAGLSLSGPDGQLFAKRRIRLCFQSVAGRVAQGQSNFAKIRSTISRDVGRQAPALQWPHSNVDVALPTRFPCAEGGRTGRSIVQAERPRLQPVPSATTFVGAQLMRRPGPELCRLSSKGIGGGNGTGIQPSPVPKSLFSLRPHTRPNSVPWKHD